MILKCCLCLKGLLMRKKQIKSQSVSMSKNGIFMRKWRPPDVSAEDEWTVNHQIVVPRVYRPEILNLAHETPMSGHLGINKIYHKILNHLYWPGLKSVVSQFCKSCYTCQMVGKHNQTIPKAHLQPIPAFDERFSRIIIDCVGHLPKTKSGHEYLRTIMCASTCFPEIIPPRNIKTKYIVKALVVFHICRPPKVCSVGSGLKLYVWNFSTGHAWVWHYTV